MGRTPAQRHTDLRNRLTIEDRRRTVAANLLAGATYTEIARALSVSRATVASDCKAILATWRSHYAETADSYLHLQIRRLDILLNAIWDRARDGDLSALDRALNILDRQSALLGLDKTPIQSTTILPIQIVEVQRTPYAALPSATDE
jgi:hypothetical protein